MSKRRDLWSADIEASQGMLGEYVMADVYGEKITGTVVAVTDRGTVTIEAHPGSCYSVGATRITGAHHGPSPMRSSRSTGEIMNDATETRTDCDPRAALAECLDLWGSGAWSDENAVHNLAEVMIHVARMLHVRTT